MDEKQLVVQLAEKAGIKCGLTDDGAVMIVFSEPGALETYTDLVVQHFGLLENAPIVPETVAADTETRELFAAPVIVAPATPEIGKRYYVTTPSGDLPGVADYDAFIFHNKALDPVLYADFPPGTEFKEITDEHPQG